MMDRNIFLIRFTTLIIFLLIFCNTTIHAQSYFDYELKTIDFSGNKTFSKSDLLANIESKESPIWFWVFLNSFTPFGDEIVLFDSANVSTDITALKAFYKSNGFFKVDVSYQIVPDSSNKKIDLIYKIIENEPFHYGKIDPDGFHSLSDYELGKVYELSSSFDSTKRFSESDLQNYISSVKGFLANNGYVLSGYDSTIIKIDTLTFNADVFIYFRTGNKYRISETVINKVGRSIEEINSKLIDEIMGIKPGDIYDQSVIDRSQIRLLKTEIFNTVDINPIISDTTDSKIPIEVNAEIGNLNQLSPEIKADNEFNYFNAGLGISYTRKNFLGDARKLSVSTSFRIIDILNFNFKNLFKSASDRDSTFQGVFDFSIKMDQPFLFGRPILTSTEIYYRSQTVTEYTENSFGALQKFDVEMPPYTFITLFRPYISMELAERSAKWQTDPSIYEIFVSVNSLTPSLGIELGSSKTDDILFPTEGNYIFITPEICHSRTTNDVLVKTYPDLLPYADTTESGKTYFYRVQIGLSNYTSLSKSKTTVLASKLRIGYAQPFTASGNRDISAEELIPPNKTFYAGGSNSVRGWRSHELVPQNQIQYAGTTVESDNLRGGTIWLEGSIEFRKKIGSYLGYAVFADYGNTWNEWNTVVLKDIAVSLGAGIRIYTPIAPFRFDFGTKFYDPFDEKMIFSKNLWDNVQFHFGIGEAF